MTPAGPRVPRARRAEAEDGTVVGARPSPRSDPRAAGPPAALAATPAAPPVLCGENRHIRPFSPHGSGLLTLTTDELAVVAERYGSVLAPMLTPDLPADGMIVAALVASRSLLARGLATTDHHGLRLTPNAYGRLAPVLQASVTVEVTLNLPGAPSSAHVVCHRGGRVVLLDEREPGVWVASEHDTDLVTTIRSLIDDDAAEGLLTVERPPGERATIGWTDAQDPNMGQQLAALLSPT